MRRHACRPHVRAHVAPFGRGRRYTGDRNCQHRHAMRPKCPRDSLENQTPQERWQVKAQLVCGWLSIMGHSTEAILREVLRVKARGICARLQRAGLLRRVTVPMSAVAVWALTAAGVRLGEFALRRRVTYLTHPERLTLSRLAHEIAVQREAVARLPTDLPGLRRVKADRELRSIDAAARPDLVIRHVDQNGTESIVCIELEMTSKASRELRQKMRAILPLLTPRTTWRWAISEGPTTVDRYARTWAEVVEADGQGYLLSQAELHRSCTFELAATAWSSSPR